MMTTKQASTDEGIRLRLPHWGCFPLFFLVFFLAIIAFIPLIKTVFRIVPVYSAPTEKVTVFDPESMLSEEDVEMVRKAAEDVSRLGMCDVAVYLLDDKLNLAYSVAQSIIAEWMVDKGVLLLFTLRDDNVYLQLVGDGWFLADWDSEKTSAVMQRIAKGRFAFKAKILLERLAHALPSAGDYPLSGHGEDMTRDAVIYATDHSVHVPMNAPVWALGFGGLFIALGVAAVVIARGHRRKVIQKNVETEARHKREKEKNPVCKLSVINGPDDESSSVFHKPVMKITAMALGAFFALCCLLSIVDGKLEITPLHGMGELMADAELPPSVSLGRVVDKADVFSPSEKAHLAAVIQEVERSTGGQIAVLTVPTLGMRSIEEFSLNVASQWQLGLKGKDNGALFVLAVEDRKNRLEVGYGWEGPVNDARAGDLLRAIVPDLRAEQYAVAAEKVVCGVERYVIESGEGVSGAVVPGGESAASHGHLNEKEGISKGGAGIEDTPRQVRGRGLLPYRHEPQDGTWFDPRQKSASDAFWAVFALMASLAGGFLIYLSRVIRTSVGELLSYDPTKVRSHTSGGANDYGSSSRSYSGHSYSSGGGGSHGGGGSFGGGGASGSW